MRKKKKETKKNTSSIITLSFTFAYYIKSNAP